MKTNYSLSFLLEDTGCYNEIQIKDLFPKGKEEVNYLDIIGSGIPLEDKFWFFCRRVFTEKQNNQITIESAECVLPLYEEKYPDNKAPIEAIEAAKLYLAGDITIKELEIKREAAVAAAVYASAGCAARAARAAAAAAAATVAVYAAAVAASAAADDYSADADADAAANTNYKQKLIDILINFIESN